MRYAAKPSPRCEKPTKGPSINDVRTERGEGVNPKHDYSTDKLGDGDSGKGGGGPKIPNFCGRHYWMVPNKRKQRTRSVTATAVEHLFANL